MAKETRVNAIIDPELKKQLYRVLLEEDQNFTDWLMGQIRAYLAAKEPKGKKPEEPPVPRIKDGVKYGPKWPLRTREGVNRNPYGPCRKCHKRHNPQNKCPKSTRQLAREELRSMI